MLLTNLLDKRQAELTHPGQRESLITLMTTLRKSGPMLSSALQTYVKYPDNPQAKVSKSPPGILFIAHCLGSHWDNHTMCNSQS